MSTSIVCATFDSVRYATAAVDWFRNQAIDPDAIGIVALPPGEPPRSTRPGDNLRTDLRWFVSVDLARTNVSKQIAIEAMKREGGKIAQAPPAGV